MRLFSTLMVFVLLMLTGLGTAPGSAEVIRDCYGIPSIVADTEEQLFEEFGYVTATAG